MPSRCFILPFDYLPPYFKEESKEKSIKELFQSSEYFNQAAGYLLCALFEPNPLDALYYVNLCLSSAMEILQQFQKDSTPFSFDDMFSIFLGIFLISDAYDIFQLNWFFDTFLPNSKLSSDFEYAKNTITALALYIKEFDIPTNMKNDYLNN